MISNFKKVKKDFALYNLTCIMREEIIASVQLRFTSEAWKYQKSIRSF